MKTIYSLLAACLFIFCLACDQQQKDQQQYPRPEGFFDYEAFEKDSIQKEYKRRYKEELYYAEEGTNVDSIRLAHMFQHMWRSRMKVAATGTFANGTIKGEWFQRGPINEAGDLREVDYDPQNDSLYVLSTVGHIWKGHLSGQSWRLLNDKVRFNTNLLKHIKKQDGGDRLIAAYGSGKENKVPRYSDDQGNTWSLPTGIGEGFYDGWGGPKKMIELSDGKTMFYMVNTWKGSPWGNAMEIYKTTDRGLSYSLVLSMNGGGYNFETADMWKPENADILYVIDNNKKQFYTINHNLSTGSTNISGPVSFSGVINGNIKLTGRYSNGNPTFYILIGGNRVYKSTNINGSVWSDLGQILINGATERIFRNVWMANPFNNQLYMGGFQFYKTSDEANWTEQYSYWWSYYDKNIALPQRKDNMHVDMMDMQLFRKADNTPYFIILNHAGIYASYDNMQSTTNLCQENLNVVTLYDHATAPDGTIFYGAQDKGTFRNTGDNNSGTTQVSSENMTTGDGMRELFFNNGLSWFGFLQNGSMICMPDKKATRQHWWQVPGDHIPGWINPVENHPDPAAKKCYVAGGNINGGAGSYLIEMEVSFTGTGSGFQWLPKQFDYDFRANSRNGRSVIKALSASTADHNRLYVATQDASFFYSTNTGTSWTRSSYALPSSLLPWDIAVSASDANKLYLCGSGWSNTGVYMSTDGGQSFSPLSNNAIPATYFDIVLSPDESVLYAATSEGPYAYIFSENSWFPISADNTPFVDFRSVEFISSAKTVRFGTYGRGVWDFVLTDEELVGDCNNDMGGTAYTDNCGTCVGGNTEKKECIDLADGIYRIHANHSLKCLYSASQVKQIDCDENQASQVWQITKQGNYYSLVNFGNELSLTYSSTANGTVLNTTSYTGADSQLFRLEDNGDGSISIIPKSDLTKTFDVYGVSQENDANIILWSRLWANNQKFTFTPVTVTKDCNNTLNGTAFTDYCGNCVGGSTGLEACQVKYSTHHIPGLIQAEEYDHGGQSVSYHDLSATNDGGSFRVSEGVDIGNIDGGGYYLGWTAAGEWTEYTVEVLDGGGKFDIHYTVASPNTGSAFHLEIDDVNITGSIVLTSTGGWQQWDRRTLTDIYIAGGTHTLKFVAETAGFDVDQIEFTESVVTGTSGSKFHEATMYPNPVESGGIVTLNAPDASKYKIINASGQMVKEGNLSGSTNINIKGWQSGTYLIELYYEEKKAIRKLIVE